MNEEQFKAKVQDLKDDVLNSSLLEDKIENFLRSGAADLDNYDDNYILPRLFMCAFAKEIGARYQPATEIRKKEAIIDNIFKMIGERLEGGERG